MNMQKSKKAQRKHAKVKESSKRNRYLDLARGKIKLLTMRVMIIPILIGWLEMVSKGLEKRLDELEIGERIETILTIAL